MRNLLQKVLTRRFLRTDSNMRPASKRPRITFIYPKLPAESGHLEDLGNTFEFTVIEGGPRRAEHSRAGGSYDTVTLRAVGPSGAFVRWVYLGLWKQLRKNDPDLVHLISEPWGFVAVQCAVYRLLHPHSLFLVQGCCRIWWHGNWAEKIAKWLLVRFVMSVADGYCAETEEIELLARANGLTASQPFASIHTNPRNAVALASSQSRESSRKELGLPLDGVGYGFLGRLSVEKGISFLLEAGQNFFEKTPDAWLAIAGAGPQENLVQQVTDKNSSVLYLGSLPFPDGVRTLFSAIDVLVIPSVTTPESADQSPRAVIEGMMSKKLLVASDCGGIPQMVGDTGLVFAEGVADGLNRCLAQAYAASCDGESTLQEVAASRAQELYSTEAVSRQLINFWSQAGLQATVGRGQ